MTRSTSSARAAAKSEASAQGLMSSPSSRRRRTSSPSGVPPGSRVATTSRPSARSASASRFACVVLPDPSRPSKVTNTAAVRYGACGRSSPEARASSARTSSMRLLARGDEVHVLDNLSRGKRENVPDGAQLHEADIRTDTEIVFAEARPEVCFHLAAQIDVRVSVERPDLDADVNVIGTLRVLEAAREHGTKVVFSSTGGAIYGECERPAREEDPRRAARALRRLEARGGGVHRGVQPALRRRARVAALRERVRAAPGSARRGRRRRDLHVRPARRQDAAHLRRRLADARLRVRRRRRRGHSRCGGARRRRVQRRHRHGDVGARAVRAHRERLGHRARSASRPKRGPASCSAACSTRRARSGSSAGSAERSLDDGLAATWAWISADMS